jgi:type IV pilus assembly protein PilM
LALGINLPIRIELPAWLRGLPTFRKPAWAWLEPRYPPVAFDLDPKALAMVRVGRRQHERFLASFDVEDLPADLIEIDFLKTKLNSQERFRTIVGKMIAKEPVKFRSASLVIPDIFARVAIMPFEELPRRRQDALDLIRYKTKKSVPFKVEEAALDFQVLRTASGGLNVLAVLLPKTVIEDFESVFTVFGVHAGLVELSTFSLVNSYQAVLGREMGPATEYLVANVTGTYFSFAIFRGEDLLFFRCKAFALGTGDDTDDASLRLLKREIQTSLLYYRDKLDGKALERAYLRVVDLDRGAVADLFSSSPDVKSVALIDAARVISVNGRVTGDQGERTLQRLLPSIGAAAGRSGR